MTMHNGLTRRHAITGALALAGAAGCVTAGPDANAPPSLSINGANWFDGYGFRPRTGYSVNGCFTFGKPPRIDLALDLSGKWLVPPLCRGSQPQHQRRNNRLGDQPKRHRPLSCGWRVLREDPGQHSAFGCAASGVWIETRQPVSMRCWRREWSPRPMAGRSCCASAYFPYLDTRARR